MKEINKFEYSQAKAILYTRIILLICILAQAVACFELCKQNKQLKSKPPEKIIVERDISPIPYKELGEYTLTFYTHTGNRTKTGVYPKVKKTIAVDPKIIPLGSVLYIDGYGVFIAEDTGSKIKGNRADIFVNTKQEAINLGVKKARVYKIGG